MPNIQNLGLYQGDDFAATVAVTSGGATADLTGYTAQAQIRADTADNISTVTYQIPATITVPPTAGNISLSIPRATTATLSGRYLWDLQLTAAGGTIQTILYGKVFVQPEVTRP
jgi:hypothetical protein